MKIVKYKIRGYMNEFNEITNREEQKEVLIEVKQPYYEGIEEAAKEKAYNGEITVEEVDEKAV
jgi:hypothetical protein